MMLFNPKKRHTDAIFQVFNTHVVVFSRDCLFVLACMKRWNSKIRSQCIYLFWCEVWHHKYAKVWSEVTKWATKACGRGTAVIQKVGRSGVSMYVICCTFRNPLINSCNKLLVYWKREKREKRPQENTGTTLIAFPEELQSFRYI